MQYWNLFLLPPPPAILLFHISSDQYWECSNLFRKSSFSLQNSIAPSSSRGNCPCRRRVFSLSATGYAWSNWAPGSISIHILSRIGTVLVDEQAEVGLLGFALVFDRLANANTSGFKRKCFRLRLRGLLLVVVVLLVDQVCDQLVQSMRNSDPRVRIVFVDRFSSNCHSIFTLQVTGCDFQYGSNFGVPLNPTYSMESAHHSSSRPDCNNTEDVPSFTLRTALSAIPFVSDLCGVDVQWFQERSSQALPNSKELSV